MSADSVRQRPPHHPVEVGSRGAWAWFLLAHALAWAGMSLFLLGSALLGDGMVWWFFTLTLLGLLGVTARKWASDRAWAQVPGAFGLLRPGEQPWAMHSAEYLALCLRGIALVGVCTLVCATFGASATAVVTGMCAYMTLGLLVTGLALRRWRPGTSFVTLVSPWALSWLVAFAMGDQAWNVGATWIGAVLGAGGGVVIWVWNTARS